MFGVRAARAEAGLIESSYVFRERPENQVQTGECTCRGKHARCI